MIIRSKYSESEESFAFGPGLDLVISLLAVLTIAFFLGSVFYNAICVAQTQTIDEYENQSLTVDEKIEALQIHIKEMEDQLKVYQTRIAVLEKDLESANEKVRLYQREFGSDIYPDCVSAGRSERDLGLIVIYGANSFKLNGRSMNMRLLLDHFENELRKAEYWKCRPLVKVQPHKSVSTSEFNKATTQLSHYFWLQTINFEAD